MRDPYKDLGKHREKECVKRLDETCRPQILLYHDDIISYRIVSCRIKIYHIMSYRIVSYHNTPVYRIISHDLV